MAVVEVVGRDVADLVHLRLDGIDDALVAVADVDAHELRIEVHVALAVGVPEVDAFGVIDDQRRDGALRGPLVEGGLAREIDDLLLWSGRRSPHESSPILRSAEFQHVQRRLTELHGVCCPLAAKPVIWLFPWVLHVPPSLRSNANYATRSATCASRRLRTWPRAELSALA